MKYIFLVTGYGCLQQVERCYESFKKLSFNGEWRAIFISDGDNDLSQWLMENINHHNIMYTLCGENNGAAYCRHAQIKELKEDNYISDDDVICLVGMDDEVMPWALSEVEKHYHAGKWMTYGNWIDQTGRGLPKTFPLEFDEATHRNRAYRQVTYRSTAMNTFKYFLYKNIPEEDFKINGQWIDSTTESEVMFSCLEMCGPERIGIVYTPIYLYNRNLPNGTLKRMGREYKYQLFDIIKSRPKKEQIKKI